MDFFLQYTYTELVTVNSLWIDMSLEIDLPHNGQISASKVAQRAKGLRDSEHEYKCLIRVHFCENHCLHACGCARELVQYTFL